MGRPRRVVAISWGRSPYARSDGLTIDQRSFFPRHAVFSIGIERGKEPGTEYNQELAAIIGTRRIVLVPSLDGPTAQVLGAAVEQARRQLWSDAT